jgi:DNA repair protein RadA/Sms
MAKAIATFSCTACGTSFPKWAGRCEACGAWNSIVEEAPLSAGPKALGPRAAPSR